MKKIKIFILLILLMIVSVTVGVMSWNHKKKNIELESVKNLEALYYKQNTALGLSYNQNERIYYHSADELELNRLIVSVDAYNSVQSKYMVTVDDVINYLSDEYDSDGKPRVCSQPENISAYIAWYNDNGSDIVFDYGDHFNEYLLTHEYSNVFGRMKYEEVVEALKKYKNDSSYVPPKQDN